MLPCADLVLMDLRGFTPERKGCVYEIGLLIDRFPINRVVFLIRSDADKPALYELIRQRWEQMSADSLNRQSQSQLIKVYETYAKANTRHMRADAARIIALLSASLDESQGAPQKALINFA